MASPFAAIKAQARQAVHNLAAVPVTYTDTFVTAAPFGARWHNSKVLTDAGNLENTGYATVLESIDSVVFDVAEVTGSGVTLRRGGVVTFTDYGISFDLINQAPSDGPVNLRWNVTRSSP